MCDAPIVEGGDYYTKATASAEKHHTICIYLILLVQILCILVQHGGMNLHKFSIALLLCLFGWNGCKCSFPSGHVLLVYTTIYHTFGYVPWSRDLMERNICRCSYQIEIVTKLLETYAGSDHHADEPYNESVP